MTKTFFKSQNFMTYYQNNTLDKERDYNLLFYKEHITEPPKIIKRNNLFFITCQNNIITKVDKNEKLNQNDILIIPNTGGGNCFYKCLSQFYNNNEEFHIYYRKIIVVCVESKKN
jgi:hypothetical protein